MDGIREPTDEANFEASMRALLRRARENDVGIEGAWKISTESNDHDYWDLQIVQVEYDDEASEQR